jgi:hypothetical protein
LDASPVEESAGTNTLCNAYAISTRVAVFVAFRRIWEARSTGISVERAQQNNKHVSANEIAGADAAGHENLVPVMDLRRYFHLTPAQKEN